MEWKACLRDLELMPIRVPALNKEVFLISMTHFFMSHTPFITLLSLFSKNPNPPISRRLHTFCCEQLWRRDCFVSSVADCPSTLPFHSLIFRGAHIPVEGSSVSRVASPFFGPFWKLITPGLFSDWGACQYYTAGELSLALHCILIHEP